jgi:hypothetical protein
MKMNFLFAALLCASVAGLQCSLNDRIAKVNDKIEMVKQNIKSGNTLGGLQYLLKCNSTGGCSVKT